MKALSNEAKPKENTQPVHSGTIEDAVKLPVGSKTSQLVLTNEEDMVPVVAFKERRSLRTLTGLEEIQTHQRAGEAWDPHVRSKRCKLEADIFVCLPAEVI